MVTSGVTSSKTTSRGSPKWSSSHSKSMRSLCELNEGHYVSDGIRITGGRSSMDLCPPEQATSTNRIQPV